MFEKDSKAKPILKWAGGKAGLLPELIKHFQTRFDRYLEPFVGAGAVFLALKEGPPALINDSNSELISLYRVVRRQPVALMDALDRLAEKYSGNFYYECRKSIPDSRVEQAARTIFLNKAGFNGLYRVNKKGCFNVPFGHRPECPRLYNTENLLSVSRRLAGTIITAGDFEVILSHAGEGDLVYCDPPYLPLTMTAAFTSYTAGGFSFHDHERLAAACSAAAKREAVVVVSNSAVPEVERLYVGNRISKVFAPRAINSMGDRRGKVQELIITMTAYDVRDWSVKREQLHTMR